jgi:hypothetical protein
MFKRIYFAGASMMLLLGVVATASGQRPRAIPDDSSQSTTTTPPPAPPSTVKAKYEGGVFGYPHKKTGSLTIDADNSRLLFRDDKQKELFSIPFGSITGAYADTHSVRPAAATVVSHIPYGFPAGFIKTKVRYLTVQYDDPDSKAAGVTSFRLETKELLDSVLYAVATKAGLTRRGEIYVRKKE